MAFLFWSKAVVLTGHSPAPADSTVYRFCQLGVDYFPGIMRCKSSGLPLYMWQDYFNLYKGTAEGKGINPGIVGNVGGNGDAETLLW